MCVKFHTNLEGGESRWETGGGRVGGGVHLFLRIPFSEKLRNKIKKENE